MKYTLLLRENKKNYLNEAIYPVSTLINHFPDTHIILVAYYSIDYKNNMPLDNTKIIQLTKNPFKMKASILQYTPYENTLFLDSDTEILKTTDEICKKCLNMNLLLHRS